MTIGEKIAYARRIMGKDWTQQRLADELTAIKMPSKRSWIAGVESNRFKPSKADLYRIAMVLNQPPNYFDEDVPVPYENISYFSDTSKSFYGRIIESREAMGLSRKEFADNLCRYGVNVTDDWVTALETGKIRAHCLDWNAICKVLGKPFEYFTKTSVSSGTLRDKDGISFAGKSKTPVLYYGLIPIIATIYSHKFALSIDEIIADEYISIPVAQNETREIFAVKIKGGFLDLWAGDGECAIISKTSRVEDGKIALIRTSISSDLKTDKCMLAEIHSTPDYIRLKKSDETSEKVKPEELDIIGKVMGFFRKHN